MDNISLFYINIVSNGGIFHLNLNKWQIFLHLITIYLLPKYKDMELQNEFNDFLSDLDKNLDKNDDIIIESNPLAINSFKNINKSSVMNVDNNNKPKISENEGSDAFITKKITEPELHRMAKYKYSIEPSGNCLYDSISYGLWATTDYGWLVRREIMNNIESNSEYFKNFIENGTINEYITKNIQPRTWGGLFI